MAGGATQEKFERTLVTQRIRELYEESGLNQGEFAAKVGICQSGVSRFLKLGDMPDSVSLFRIALACRVSVDWLVGLKDERR